MDNGYDKKIEDWRKSPMRKLEKGDKLLEKEILITINSFMNITTFYFASLPYHSISNLKKYLAKETECDYHEITIFIGPDYPYPLDDKIFLNDLLENHRTLHFIISENPEKAIPKRLLIEKDGKKYLDLRKADDHDICFSYIDNWIVTYGTYNCKYVMLHWEHPLFCKILNLITTSLDNTGYIEQMPYYPLHYFIDSSKGYIMDQDRLKELRYFYRKMGESKCFNRVALYTKLSFFGEDIEEIQDIKDIQDIQDTNKYIRLEKENTKKVDLILSDLIWLYKS